MVMVEKKKEYPSLQDMSPSEYMYFPKGSLEEGRPGHFSRRELLDLSLAVLVLTVAFSFSISRNNFFWGFSNLSDLLVSFLLACVLVYVGIIRPLFGAFRGVRV